MGKLRQQRTQSVQANRVREKSSFSGSLPSISVSIYPCTQLTRQKQSPTTACYEFYHLDSCSRQLFSDSPSGLFACPWLWRKVVPNSFLNPTAVAVPLALFHLLFKRRLLSHILLFLHLLLAFKKRGQQPLPIILAFEGNFIHKTSSCCLCLATLQSGFHSQSAFGTPLLNTWLPICTMKCVSLQQHLKPMTATSLMKHPLSVAVTSWFFCYLSGSSYTTAKNKIKA